MRGEFKRRQWRAENFILFDLGPRVSLSGPGYHHSSALTTAHHNGLGGTEIIAYPVCSCPFVSQTGQRCGAAPSQFKVGKSGTVSSKKESA